MNAERLKEIVDFLVQTETTHSTQSTLETALQNLNNLLGNPNQPNFQKEFVSNLERVRNINSH